MAYLSATTYPSSTTYLGLEVPDVRGSITITDPRSSIVVTRAAGVRIVVSNPKSTIEVG